MSTPFTFTTAESPDGRGVTLTGRSNGVVPSAGAPVVVAIHGGGYTSAYFDVPGYSLLDRGAEAGIAVLAIDRPNYGGSSPLAAGDSLILANAELLGRVLPALVAEQASGGSGLVLVGHSIGGAVVTAIAASHPDWPLLGIATSGCLVVEPDGTAERWDGLAGIPVIELPFEAIDPVLFGPPSTHGPDMPAASHPANSPAPTAELVDISHGWIARRAAVCSAVRVPVQHRHGEFDFLWVTDDEQLAEYARGFSSSPDVDAALVRGSGHCIDFHLPGPAVQQEQLDFALRVAR